MSRPVKIMLMVSAVSFSLAAWAASGDSILFYETPSNTFTCLTIAQRMCTNVPSHPIEDLNHCLGQHFDRCGGE